MKLRSSQSLPPHPYRAAAWIGNGQRAVAIFPLRAFVGAALLIASLAVIGLLVEFQLRHLASANLIASSPWVQENQTINTENYKKILNTPDAPLFTTLGYRVPGKNSSRQRILVIGDSFIWGDGYVNINDLWWRQLQWELERRGYRNVDVIAAGVCGAGTQDYFNWLTKGRLLEKTQPDAVVIAYVTNDAEMKDLDGNSLVKQLAPKPVTQAWQSSPLARILPTLFYQLSSRALNVPESEQNDATGYSYYLWELKLLEGENFRKYKRLLGQFEELIKQASIPVFFVGTPNSPEKQKFEPRYQPIRKAFADAGIEFEDLLPALLACCSTVGGQVQWGINPINGHPGPRMTHFYAVQVADILERRFPRLLGARDERAASYAPEINDWMPASVQPRAVAPGEWVFNAPEDKATLLQLPIGKPHLALNFERPVVIHAVHLATDEESRFGVWATVLDGTGNFEETDYLALGEGQGRSLDIRLTGEAATSRITSLRISIDRTNGSGIGGGTYEEKAVLEASRIVPRKGKAFIYALPDLSIAGDGMGAPARSPLVVLEGGKPLGLPHSSHVDIEKYGEGRYSHWNSDLVFSSSDNTDPRTNGRRYSVAVEKPRSPVRLTVDFGSPAVVL